MYKWFKEGGFVQFPNEKLIYEIPIYSMSESEFKQRWDKWKDKWYDASSQIGHTEEEKEEIVRSIMNNQYPKNVWKYNQIVGFVEISINNNIDVTFNVQKTLDTKIRAVGKTKHYIQDMMTNGMHFYAGTSTNLEIISEIDSYLDSIEKGLKKPFYLYRDTYDNLKYYIDFKGMLEKNK